MVVAPAMVQAAALRREAGDSAQETCTDGVLMACGTAFTVQDDGEEAAYVAPAPELAPC